MLRHNITTVKLIDFAFTVKVLQSNFSDAILYGTPEFLAHELVRSFFDNTIISYDHKTEMYALGHTLRRFLGFSSLVCRTWGFNQFENDQPPVTELTDDPSVAHFVHQLIEKDPDVRISLDLALKTLDNIRNQLKAKYPVKISIIHIQEFLSAKHFQRKLLLEGIKKDKINQIVLIDKTGQYRDDTIYNNKILLQIRRELEKESMIIRNDILVSPTGDMKSYSDYFSDIEKTENIEIIASQFSYQGDKLETLPIFGKSFLENANKAITSEKSLPTHHKMDFINSHSTILTKGVAKLPRQQPLDFSQFKMKYPQQQKTFIDKAHSHSDKTNLQSNVTFSLSKKANSVCSSDK